MSNFLLLSSVPFHESSPVSQSFCDDFLSTTTETLNSHKPTCKMTCSWCFLSREANIELELVIQGDIAKASDMIMMPKSVCAFGLYS